jgi:hypothetical protein
VLLGDRDGRWRSACLYWAGLTSVAAVALAIVGPAYLHGLEAGGMQVTPRATTVARLLHYPWLLVAPGAALLGVELAMTALRRRLAARAGGPIDRTIGRVALAAAVALFVLFAASLWLPYPKLDPIDPAHPPVTWAYVKSAVAACATFLRFGRPDNLTSITFWGGFGWLDTLPPNLFVSLLAASSGLSLVMLLVWVARTASSRLLVWLMCAGAGFVLSAAAYAFIIVRATPADLHGRYLLGLYVCVLVIAWSSVARTVDSGWIRHPDRWIAAAWLCCLGIHAYCLTFILARYF